MDEGDTAGYLRLHQPDRSYLLFSGQDQFTALSRTDSHDVDDPAGSGGCGQEVPETKTGIHTGKSARERQYRISRTT